MIRRMAKPEEVLIVEDENGEIVRELTKDTEVIAQYKTMREALVYLTHLNYEDTENIMLDKLSNQVNGTEWSWNNLNTLCWAIGSISGAMNEEEEKRFLGRSSRTCSDVRDEARQGQQGGHRVRHHVRRRPVPALPARALKFLKTVVNKLFEFMHELHPGVQDMACDTYLRSRKCKRKFVAHRRASPRVIHELCAQLPTIISDLESHQVHTF